MTVVLQRKVGNGSWKSIAQLKTDANGKWSSKRYAGSKKSTVSYRVKIDDSRVGKLTSKVQKTAIK
jgi:5-hydroxyisourate hydrolase-like protein (transthyretin family)